MKIVLQLILGALMAVILVPEVSFSQDTTFVQTLSFTDTTRRKGTFKFPPKTKKWQKVLMYYTLKCDKATTQDKYPCGEWDYETTTYIYDHHNTYDTGSPVYEISRFITPYGINLSLGKDGFTWVFDVTDYAGLLYDSVELSAGNQQELIDLEFVMIEGTPFREVLDIRQLHNQGRVSYTYADLDKDIAAPSVSFTPGISTKMARLRTRLSGHGHNSDDGSFPHCCEWKDNAHSIFIDNTLADQWHIWRDDCNMNPVYPQGGTWPGSREGWCPGDGVRDHETEITSYLAPGKTLSIDYRITPVPTGNQGMGKGRYLFAMHLFEYGNANFVNDAGIYAVSRPNSHKLYSRYNPVCNEPVVTLRNTGSGNLTSAEIEYKVSGGKTYTYQWKGSLGYLETEEVTLPVTEPSFWYGDGANRFTVTVSKPNGATDENAVNNSYTTSYQLPETYQGDLVILLRTNSVPEDNYYTVQDITGKEIFRKDNLAPNTIYQDTLKLGMGCYSFEFFDEGYGLSYWAWPAQGNGFLLFRSTQGGILKSFEADFGKKINHDFTIGYSLKNEIPQSSIAIDVFPNPAEDRLNVFIPEFFDVRSISLINASGQAVSTYNPLQTAELHTINTSLLPPGVYLVKVTGIKEVVTRKVIIR